MELVEWDWKQTNQGLELNSMIDTHAMGKQCAAGGYVTDSF